MSVDYTKATPGKHMVWMRRMFIAFPFVIAAALTVLMNTVSRGHLQRVSGYGFIFDAPWAWLLDRGWLENVHSRRAEALIAYALIDHD